MTRYDKDKSQPLEEQGPILSTRPCKGVSAFTVGRCSSAGADQGFGSGSGLDPDSIGPVDPDPDSDPGGQK
jgi:hypothetical protein